MAMMKTGPNKWRIVVSVRAPGRPEPMKKRETFTGTKTEAEVRKTEIIRELRESASSLKLVPCISTFTEAVTIFREKRGPFSSSHDRKIEYIEQETGHLSLDEYADRFEQWLHVLKQTAPKHHQRKRSAASSNRYIEIVRAVFGLLVELEIIRENPITKARFPKGEERPRDRYLTETERLKLMNAIREHRPYILPFVEYSLAVPCRKSELTAAKREQFDPFTNTIYIPTTKGGFPVTKPVPPNMIEYFRSIPAECPWLFYWQDAEGNYHQFGTMQKPWAFCVKKAGLKNVRIHDLRHVAASDLYASGIPEREIMDVAGWKTPMLSTYRHRDSLKSAQKINALFEGNTTPCFSAAVNQ